MQQSHLTALQAHTANTATSISAAGARRWPLWLITTLSVVASLLAIPQALAQQFLLDTDSAFGPVQDAIIQQQPELAEQRLQAMAADYDQQGDFYYLQAVITMVEMRDAGTLRMPFMARRMRKQLESALQVEPSHELAHFGLFQWHQFAPAIIGASDESAAYHRQRLGELNSNLRFPADLALAMADEDVAEQERIYQLWFEADPDNLQAQTDYVAQRIYQGHYDLARQQLRKLSQQIEPDLLAHQKVATQLDYQWGRLAAESGTELEQGYQSLNELLRTGVLPENISADWVKFRLAQIYQHQNQQEQARDIVRQLNVDNDRRLKTAIDDFANTLTTNSNS